MEKAWSLDIRPDGPVVKHFISVNKELLGGKRTDPFVPPPAGHGRPVRHEDVNAERTGLSPVDCCLEFLRILPAHLPERPRMIGRIVSWPAKRCDVQCLLDRVAIIC